MELTEAIRLIQNEYFAQQGATTWADLGCGSGLFSFALAHLLAAGSTIHAVDRNPVVLQEQNRLVDVVIQPLQLDFETDPLPFRDLDGILMANSLHYVSGKKALLNKLSASLKPGGSFLIVEYDTDKPAPPWVPYPLSFRSLQQVFAKSGYLNVEKLGERASAFGRANMYAALFQ